MDATVTQQPAAAATPEKTWDEILDAMNGQTYTLDGVHGTIKVERNPSALHGGLLLLKVAHEPSARGKRSEAYLQVKRQFHDDYDTDLTWSERLVDIAVALGLTKPDTGMVDGGARR